MADDPWWERDRRVRIARPRGQRQQDDGNWWEQDEPVRDDIDDVRAALGRARQSYEERLTGTPEGRAEMRRRTGGVGIQTEEDRGEIEIEGQSGNVRLATPTEGRSPYRVAQRENATRSANENRPQHVNDVLAYIGTTRNRQTPETTPWLYRNGRRIPDQEIAEQVMQAQGQIDGMTPADATRYLFGTLDERQSLGGEQPRNQRDPFGSGGDSRARGPEEQLRPERYSEGELRQLARQMAEERAAQREEVFGDAGPVGRFFTGIRHRVFATGQQTIGGLTEAAASLLGGTPEEGIERNSDIQGADWQQTLANWGRRLGERGMFRRDVADPGYEQGSLQRYVFEGTAAILETAGTYGVGKAGGLLARGRAARAAEAAGHVATSPRGQAFIVAHTARTFGRSYDEAVARGADPAEAWIESTYRTLAEVLPERTVVGAILNPGTSTLRRVATGVAGEATQEAFTEVLNIAYDAGVIGEDMTLDEAWNRIKDAGIIGGLVGGGMSAGVSAREGIDRVSQRFDSPERQIYEQVRGTDFDIDTAAREALRDPASPRITSPLPPRQDGRPRARGIRESVIDEPVITPQDEASPLGTDLIEEGRRLMADAEASVEADALLAANGAPGTRSRVAINFGNRRVSGTVIDGFETDDGELGRNAGIRIRLDDGTIFDEYFSTIRESGISIEEEAPAVELTEPGQSITLSPGGTRAPAPAPRQRVRRGGAVGGGATAGGAAFEGGDPIAAYMRIARGAESGGRDDAQNPRSSAGGRYQFINSTFRSYYQRVYGRALPGGPNDPVDPAIKNDPEVQERLMRAFTEDNARALERAGVAVNPTNLYFAHHFGSAGAISMMRNPNAAVAADVAEANPHLRGMTNAQALQRTAQHFGGSARGAGVDLPDYTGQDFGLGDFQPTEVEPLEETSGQRMIRQATEAPELEAPPSLEGERLPEPAPITEAPAPAPVTNITIEPTASGKGLTISGTTEADVARLRAALPERVSIVPNSRGELVVSRKYEEQVRAALEQRSEPERMTGDTAAPEIGARFTYQTPQGETVTATIEGFGETSESGQPFYNGRIEGSGTPTQVLVSDATLITEPPAPPSGGAPAGMGSPAGATTQPDMFGGPELSAYEMDARREVPTIVATAREDGQRTLDDLQDRAEEVLNITGADPDYDRISRDNLATAAGRTFESNEEAQTFARSILSELGINPEERAAEIARELAPEALDAPAPETAGPVTSGAPASSRSEAGAIPTEPTKQDQLQAQLAAKGASAEPRLDRQQIAQRRADHLQREVMQTDRDFAEMIHTRDYWGLRDHLRPDNKKSRQTFTEATGVKLPASNAATLEAVRRWAGVTEEQVAQRAQADERARAAARRESDLKFARDAAERVTVNAPEGRTTGAAWVDARVAEGYSRLVNTSRGAVPRYALANERNQGFPISKELLQYAKLVAGEPAAAPAEIDEPAPKLTEEEAAALEGMTVEEYRQAIKDTEELFQTPEERAAAKKPVDRSVAIVMDPATGTVTTVPVGTQPEAVARREREAGVTKPVTPERTPVDIGADAFGRGEPRVPPSALTSSDQRKWLEGWDRANLAAPVESREEEVRAEARKVLEEAEQHQAALAEFGAAFPSFSNPGLKGLDRIVEKVTREDYANARALKDIVRGGFFVDSAEEAERIATAIRERFTIAQDKGWQVIDGGYMDHKLIVEFEGGIRGELQIVPREVWDIKKGVGDPLYNRWRKMEATPEAEAVEREMAELYLKALAGGSFSALASASISASGNALTKAVWESVRPSLRTSAETPRQDPSRQSSANNLPPRSPSTTGRSSTSRNETDIGLPSSPKVGPAVSENKIFTEDAAERARAILREKFKNLNSGLDPETALAGITLAGYHIERGARTFAAYAQAMIGDIGAGVRPYLRSWYEAIRYDPRAAEFAADMSGPEDIGAALAALEAQPESAISGPEEGNGQVGGSANEGVGASRERAADQGRVGAGVSPGDRASDVLEAGAAEDGRGAGAEGSRGAGARPEPQDARSGEGQSEGGDAALGRARGSRERLADEGARGRERRPSDKSGRAASRPDYHIADPASVIGGTPKVRFAKNRAAIEAYQRVTEEQREPTKAELEAIAAYTGWGSFGQELFQGSWGWKRPKAGWETEDEWLRTHLGQEEWESAQRSIINAHYTDPPTVQTMWAMAERMGFTGGRVLEPSMGIGNFFSLMPKKLKAASDLTGIEMDKLTGGMAQLLFPNSIIHRMPYQDSKTPDGFYDLVIGNWPFAKDGPADRRYLKLAPSLHDYFFLKALDQTRAGGIVMGVTSAGTMDKKGRATRMELAKKAELIAAFRLPSGAFEEYAGTSVVTDILIFRKRETPILDVSGESWIDTFDKKVGSDTITVNAYWQANPNNVLGELAFGSGSTYGRPSMIVNRPADLRERLAGLPKKLKKGTFQPVERGEEPRFITNNSAARYGSLVVGEDGNLYQSQGERLVRVDDIAKAKINPKRDIQARSLIELRGLYGQLIDAERDGAANTEELRGKLNTAYQAFKKAHGTIADSEGLRLLKWVGDPSTPTIAALERPDGTPSRILSEPVSRAVRKLENPSIREAFVLQRNKGLKVDIEEIAALAGRPAEDVEADLVESRAIFRTPGGGFEVSDIYLSGNVRAKLADALAAAEQGENLDLTIEALREVQPADIPYFQIEAKLGATWVGNADYKAFVTTLLGTDLDAKIRIGFKAGRWRIKIDDHYLLNKPEATTIWGHPNMAFDVILRHALNNTSPKIYRKDEAGNRVLDEGASREAAEKATRIREEFAAWAWRDPQRRVRLEKAYNETMNAVATPQFDGSFLEFPGMALDMYGGPFSLREHQVNAIWRGIANGRGLYAHEVGTGKTMTIGGIAVEGRRFGVHRKPLILGHNANSATVAREIQEMYPGAAVLYIDNLSPDTIAVTLRRIRNEDWDAVVMPHSLIDRMALSQETLEALAAEQIAEIEEEAILAAEEEGRELTVAMMDDPEAMKKVRSTTAKQLVHTRNRIITEIQKMALKSSKDGAVSFEELGIDAIIVDEAHVFKKPPIATQMTMKGLNKASSSRSIALQFLTNYVKRNSNGKGVHLFTGTPITNTLVEIYNMQRFVMDDVMKRDGIVDWDSWFNTFADATTDVELNAAGEYEPVTRLASFVNVAELRRIAGQYLDIVFADEMPEFAPRPTKSGKTLTDPTLTEAERAELVDGRNEKPVGRPYRKTINDVAPMGPAQAAIMEVLVQRSRFFRALSKKDRREAMLAGEEYTPIRVETDAANASLDVRLYDEAAPDEESSKVNRAVRNVVKHYKEHKLSSQVIFMERGFSDSSVRKGEKVRRLNLAKALVEKLEAAGIPRKEIAIVDGSTSKEKRKQIADAVSAGEIRVVIGSTGTLGTGVNMQKNLRAMHHLDAPWMPGELEQRNGRGWRQGNRWNTVLEYRYITEKLDGRRWQVLAVKDRFIKAFLHADENMRVIEGDAVDVSEGSEGGELIQTLSEAAGDPRVLMREKLKADIRKLENRERQHTFGIVDATNMARELREVIATEEKRVPTLAADAEHAAKLREGKGKSAFKAVIEGKTYTERPDATKAIEKAIGDYAIKAGGFSGADARVPEIEVNGFRLIVTGVSRYTRSPTYKLERQDRHDVTTPSLQGFENVIRGVPSYSQEHAEWLEEQRASATRLEEASKLPFAQADSLAKRQAMLANIEADLQANPVPPPHWLRTGAPVNTEIFVRVREPSTQARSNRRSYVMGRRKAPVIPGRENVEKRVVEGHRWTKDDWIIVTEQGELSYKDALDENSLPIYEERPFEAPVVEQAQPDPNAQPLRTQPVNRRQFLAGVAVTAAGFTYAGKLFAQPAPLTAILDRARNAPISLTEPVRWLAANSRNPIIRRMAERIAPLVEGVRLYVAPQLEGVHPSGAAVPGVVRYSEAHGVYFTDEQGSDQVWLAAGDVANGLNERTLIHEALHAAIDRHYGRLSLRLAGNTAEILRQEGHDRAALPREEEAGDLEALRRLWNRANARLDTMTAEGNMERMLEANLRLAFQSPDEMLSNAIEDPQVQEFLRGMEGDPELDPRSGWQAFLDWVSSLFGSASPSRTALDDLLDATNRLLTTSQGRPTIPAGVGERASRASLLQAVNPAETFSDPETERRYQDASKGVGDGPAFIEKHRGWLDEVWQSITRHWKHLPNEPRFADLQQQFRKLEAAPEAATEETVRRLTAMVKGLNRKHYDLFRRKVLLDDLQWEAEIGHKLPFGFTPESLTRDKAAVDAAVELAENKAVAEAVRRRKLVNKQLADEMVAAGVLTRDQIKNPAYYRHMVLQYARAEMQNAQDKNSKIRSPYWAKRLGSELDINANFLEAEFDWMHKALVDIATARTIEWIKGSKHNIREQLRAQAKAANKAKVKALVDADTKKNGAKIERGPIATQDLIFRQNMARGFGIIADELKAGNITGIPPHFQQAADDIENGVRGGDTPFAFLSWIADNAKPGTIGALMVLKAVGQRRAWERKLLGQEWIDPEDMDGLIKAYGKEGYATWQPIEGRHLFTAKTIGESALDMFVARLADTEMPGINHDELARALGTIRKQLVVGGDRYTMILPQEVVDTLNEFGDRAAQGLTARLFSSIQGGWKRWMLINPRRWFKYNLNNMTGDLDAILAGNPGTLKKVGQAWREIWAVWVNKEKPSQDFLDAQERGVFSSGMSVQEIPDINRLSSFRMLAEAPSKRPDKLLIQAAALVWGGLRNSTDFREALFRYAAYLDYVDKIRKGTEQKKIGYGASLPRMVDAVPGVEDRAALLARDLIGDYGAISVTGGWLRRYLMPFWSWMEINTRRYKRLVSNAAHESLWKGVATGSALAASQGAKTAAFLAIRMGIVYGVIHGINMLFFADEEEELGDFQKRQMHLILGRDENGEIVTLRMQGALSDVLGTFGYPDLMAGIRSWQDGQGSLGDALTAMAKAPVNKLASQISPIYTTPLLELPTGRDFWPDLFEPRQIHDRWRHTAATFTLENEYDAALDIFGYEQPSRGYGRSWAEAFVYRRDPGEMAYDTAKGMAYDWLERERGQEGGGFGNTPRGRALREYRQAIRYGDDAAANAALDRFEAAGGTERGFNQSVAKQHPLGPISKRDRAEYLDSLTDDQYDVLLRAEEWYNRIFLNRLTDAEREATREPDETMLEAAE